jgi:radical SAM superfamily enzyme YgiQ (UPF0313 family)
MSIKATLVYAGITQCGFAASLDDEGSYIHHGLASIAASAKERGHRIDLLDLRRLSGWDDFADRVAASDAGVFGLTMNSLDSALVVRCARLIRRRAPEARIVVGGIHPSVMTDDVAQHDCFDHIVTGEGEITFSDLLESVERSETFPRIVRGTPPDLETLPFVDRDLFEAREDPRMPGFESPFVTVIAGRGCVYNCSFCQPAERILFGAKVRRRSVANLMRELEELRARYAFRSLMIHDDCLTEDAAWVAGFTEAYRAGGFTAPFICQSRADFICRRPDLMKRLRDAGLDSLIIGFESGNQRVLNFLRKGTKVAQSFEAARICRELGIRVWANYMLGIPTETKEEVMETVRMIRAIRPDHCSPAFFTPHPGSHLFDYCRERNLSLIADPSDYRRSPRGAKIAGVDYDFLDQALQMSLGNLPLPSGNAVRDAYHRLVSLIRRVARKVRRVVTGR